MPQSDGRFRPAHPTHAIQQFIVQVMFTGGLPEADMTSVPRWRPLREKVAEELPAFGTEAGMVLSNRDAPQMGIRKATVALNFASIAKDGTAARLLRIDSHSIAYLTTQYTHWPNVRDEACKFINLALEDCVIPQGLAVGEASIQYSNVFFWDGEPSALDTRQLLQEPSIWINPGAYGLSENWHCHCGQFQRVNSHIRRLTQVNTAVVDVEELTGHKRAVSIQVSLSDALNMPNYSNSDLPTGEAAAVWISERLEHLHTAEKLILADVILPSMQERITLEAGKHA